MRQIIAGPAVVAGYMGHWGVEVPQGRYVVVIDDDVIPAGRGPVMDGANILFTSRPRAAAYLAARDRGLDVDDARDEARRLVP